MGATAAAGARVDARDLWRRFGPDPPVLRGIDLQLAPGEVVAITGASGSGKSTLLQLLGGLDAPNRGVIEIDGRRVEARRNPVELHRHVIGFVFQLHHLLPELTAQGNVELPLIACHVGRAERRARAREALEQVGVGHRADHLPSQLSGGERQRVALARAIVHRPRLLLADEPSAGLDADSAEQVAAVLDAIRQAGTTMVIVTHDPLMTQGAHRRLTLADGALREADVTGPVVAP